MRSQEEIEMLEAAQEKMKQPYVSITSLPSTPNNCAENDLPARPDHRRSLMDSVDKWWLWELMAWAIAVFSLMGIIILLKTRDNKPVPDWSIKTVVRGRSVQTKITINAVISVFSTILKSTIMIPVAAAVSQLKWLWFHDGRNKLSDVQLFDAANRGPLGSFVLLWQMRGRQVVCLGAVITITMLGLDFAFQSVVTYPTRSVATLDAYIPIVHSYSSVLSPWNEIQSHLSVNGGIEADPSIKSAMRSIIYDVNSPFLLTPYCPTGNCTWEHQYVSLGVCSECFDATGILNKTCGMTTNLQNINPLSYTCNYSWPDTGDMDPYFNDYFNMIPGNGWSCEATTGINTCYTEFAVSTGFNYFFKDLTQPLVILSLMNATWESEQVQVNATQCALKMCVKKYEASMDQNIFSETLIDEFVNKTASAVFTSYASDGTVLTGTDYSITPPDVFMNGTDPSSPKTFATTLHVIYSISAVIGDLWKGSIVQPSQTTSILGVTDVTTYLRSLDTEGMTQMMSSLAGNMTNAMRMSSANRTSSTNLNGVGQVNQGQPFVEVNWAWLAFPIFELAMTLLFLLLTMQVSAKHEGMLWKGSALAPFYYPLTKDGREKVGNAVTPRQMEDIANSLQVKWEETDRGLRLVQH